MMSNISIQCALFKPLKCASTLRFLLMKYCQTEVRYSHSGMLGCYDLAIVGGGIIGVTVARQMVIDNPSLRVVLLEKEATLAAHQTGHNSGVIHAGIYYKPETPKAKFCIQGLKSMYEFCDKNNIPYKRCGKLIVATDENEIPMLEYLYMRASKNKAQDIEMIDKSRIRELEPHCRGVRAIHSPNTGIVDYAQVTHVCAKHFLDMGGTVVNNFEVSEFQEAKEGNKHISLEYPILLIDKKKGREVNARFALTCGGLYSDKLCEACYGSEDPKVIPFRGEYLLLSEQKRHLINGNVYPVPVSGLPFLGVHFTPRLDGNIWIGPNAVLAFCREGYSWNDFKTDELLDTLRYPGFRKLAWKYGKFGLMEMMRSKFISMQLKSIRKYFPEITINDISRGPAGVRAQALDLEGNLVEDIILQIGESNIDARIMHCRNAPSPSATSSLPIAKFIASKLRKEFFEKS